MAFAVVALLAARRSASSEECVYVSDNEHTELVVVQGDETRRIATGVPFPEKIVVAGEAAYVNSVGFSQPGTVVEVDLIENRVARTFPVGRGNSDIEHANGKLYVPNQTDGTVTIINLVNGASRDLQGVPSAGRVVPFADGTTMLVGSGSTVYFLDTETDQVTSTFAPPGGFLGLAADGASLSFTTPEGDLVA